MLSWLSILRLGLVQMCLGAIVVLMTSTLNRLMVVELALPALLPGFLVALHYGVQLTRPNWGFRSDRGGRRSTWIIGGMVILACGGLVPRPPYLCLSIIFDGAWSYRSSPIALSDWVLARLEPRYWLYWQRPQHHAAALPPPRSHG